MVAVLVLQVLIIIMLLMVAILFFQRLLQQVVVGVLVQDHLELLRVVDRVVGVVMA